ncbi:hypothetical protein [Occallatibacter riparius]|uniref:Beta-glucuronidase C-terminal domain-containing protein n=1 Tax=Occallatibacter riparius TaxID=1002689 RepID=A0A9J7BTB1_9BACT|nr:hypothetical protein [Occallatibacter riparius]UWZ85871.1 hypothetical protein MOP44_07990 [Occallatibacter riparius]
MTTITRRRFVANAALAVAAGTLRAQTNNAAQATLDIPAEANGAHMPEDFVGLSYEVQQLTDVAFFSPANTGLIEQCKALATHGVLRLGGNTSEFGWFKATPESQEPEHPHTREVEGEPKAQYYAVTPEAIRNLAEFLKATGWSCLYGIGMGTNTPERAAAEAEFVAKTLGAGLQYFQIGNEADLFRNHLRDPNTWGVKAYLEEWLALARAVAAKVPNAKFGMPDVAASVDWLPQIAEAWPSIQNPPRVTRLTHHYYFGGPATNPNVNIPNLLKPATMARVQKDADMAAGAAKKMGVGVRMTEGNTCYRGGKPGVSDVFAAALWAADYALLLAWNGYSGVNLHGGTGKSVANSVGGFLPGDVMLKDQGKTAEEIATHPHPFYTPIGTFGDKYALEPVAHGLKFAGAFAGGTFVRSDLTAKLQAAGVNATAYAVKRAGGAVSAIILNKDLEKDVSVTLDVAGARNGAVKTETLQAAAIDSREAHIVRGNQAGRLNDGKYTIAVPHASGVRVTIG